MIKNKKLLENFEKELIKNSKIDIEEKFFILNELYKFAKEIVKFPTNDILKGIEIDIKYARAINGIKGAKKKFSKSLKEK
jgi:hypothetical protein